MLVVVCVCVCGGDTCYMRKGVNGGLAIIPGLLGSSLFTAQQKFILYAVILVSRHELLDSTGHVTIDVLM